jgi:hypothetical protein
MELVPCLIIGHFHQHGPPPELEYLFSFHAIALWLSPWWNIWDTILWTPWQAYYPWDRVDPTPEQIGLGQALIAAPELISDVCSYCHQSFSHPWHVRWNFFRGGSVGVWPVNINGLARERIPACWWDGGDPPQYTPDQWPPLWL